MTHKTLISIALAGASIVATAQNAPKYIFYCIGDGMGMGQIMGTDTYNRLTEGRTSPLLWEQWPVASICTTYSASSPVTDSAAAGTALATGVKTKNNMLGMGPDTTAVRSVADDLHTAGYGIALVTNVCPDDATPAAFYAHVPNRGMVRDIALQAAESPVLFLAGHRLRGANRRGEYTGLYEDMEQRGMTVVKGLNALQKSDATRIALVNDADTLADHAGYAIDHPEQWNLLRDYTKAGLKHVMKHSPEKFFMMVEGGNIDWAGHDNDAATIVREVNDYEETLGVIYDFYLCHPDETLIIVTADHETGGMSVGQRSVGYNCYPQYIDTQSTSKATFNDYCNSLLKGETTPGWEEMKQLLTDRFGLYKEVKVSQAADSNLHEAFRRTFITRNDYKNDALYHRFPEFVEAVFDVITGTQGYGFTTSNHSGNPVGVYAIGCGAESFGRPLDNTDIPQIIRQLTIK